MWSRLYRPLSWHPTIPNSHYFPFSHLWTKHPRFHPFCTRRVEDSTCTVGPLPSLSLLTLTDILSSINILPLCPFSHWHLFFPFFPFIHFLFCFYWILVCIFFLGRKPYFSHELPSSMPMQASGSGCVVCWMGLGGREKEREVGRGGEREDTD